MSVDFKKQRIAIFGSGTGSNALRIMEYFKDSEIAEVVLVVSNRSKAKILEHAQTCGVEGQFWNKAFFAEGDQVLQALKEVDWIVLAGFLKLIPAYLVKAFPNRIVNIHPALLPQFGGAGMYGMHVHEAVKAAGVMETGITIHYVNEHFDEGASIFQARTNIEPTDRPEDIQVKVQALEHAYYPLVLEQLFTS